MVIQTLATVSILAFSLRHPGLIMVAYSVEVASALQLEAFSALPLPNQLQLEAFSVLHLPMHQLPEEVYLARQPLWCRQEATALLVRYYLELRNLISLNLLPSQQVFSALLMPSQLQELHSLHLVGRVSLRLPNWPLWEEVDYLELNILLLDNVYLDQLDKLLD